MTTWFTSDLHFWHKRICEFCNRPFSSVEEMNEILIKNYNNLVMPDDECYILGDFSFGNAVQTENILKRLNGKKYLVKGNHDLEKNTLSQECIKYFEWVKDYYELKIQDSDRLSGETLLILCHYPMLTWNGAHKTDKNGTPKSLMLHGHSHGSLNYLNDKTTRIDVGVDAGDYKYSPISFEHIKSLLKNKTYEVVDNHGESK